MAVFWRCLVVLLSLTVGWSVQAGGVAIHLRGSNSLLPAAQKVAEAYMARNADAVIVVRGGDSLPGLKALLDGTVEVAMISSDIPPEVSKRAKALSLALSVQAVALDAVVPVVHPSNPLSSLSRDYLGGLYRGVVDDWSRLGGPAGKVTLFTLPLNSGTGSVWEEEVLDGGVQTPRAQQVGSDGMTTAVAADPAAVGYVGLEALDPSVKALAVDGVVASHRSVQDGSYPLRRQLALVTTNRSSPATADFVAFFMSAEAQKLVEDSGFVPLRSAP